MLKKALHEKAFGTDGWFSFDPADTAFIEAVYKKTTRDGEERLMFAVVENAVEYFQKYVLFSGMAVTPLTGDFRYH